MPERVWPGGQVRTQAAQARLEVSEQGLVSYSAPATQVVQAVQKGLLDPPHVPERYWPALHVFVQLEQAKLLCTVQAPVTYLPEGQEVAHGEQASRVVVVLKVLAGQAMHWRSANGPHGKAGSGWNPAAQVLRQERQTRLEVPVGAVA